MATTPTRGRCTTSSATARAATRAHLLSPCPSPAPAWSCRLTGVRLAALAEDDAGCWRVCVDSSEAGDLAACTLLAPFRIEHRHGTLDAVSLLNYAVDVFDEGKRVVLAVDAGAHGTHVAGIIGAHYPGRPEVRGPRAPRELPKGGSRTGAARRPRRGGAVRRG